MRRRRLSAALATLALTAALGAGATASATAATPTDDGPAAPLCVTGYVCVHHDRIITLVPEGEGHRFDPPVAITSVVNSTKIPYCIGGTYNTGVGPGGGVFEPPVGYKYTLSYVTPSPGGVCLANDG